MTRFSDRPIFLPVLAGGLMVVVLINAAPQPLTAEFTSAPSQEGVGQGGTAVAAPSERIWGVTSKGIAYVCESHSLIEFCMMLGERR